MPISWRNRKYGEVKLKIKEMGSRYFFICAYVWLERLALCEEIIAILSASIRKLRDTP